MSDRGLHVFIGSGGGVRTGSGVGARRHLILNKGIAFHSEWSNSGDVLNGAVMCQYPRGELLPGICRLEGIWRGIEKATDVMRKLWAWQYLNHMAFATCRPLWQIFKRVVDPDLITASGRAFGFAVTDLTRKRGFVVREDFEYPWLPQNAPKNGKLTKRDKLMLMRGSWTVPFYSHPIIRRTHVLVDGGLTINTPIAAALDWIINHPVFKYEGATIYLNECYDNHLQENPLLYNEGIGPYVAAMLEATLHDNWIGDVNQGLEVAEQHGIKVHRVMMPNSQQGDPMDFQKETIWRYISWGYEAWKREVP